MRLLSTGPENSVKDSPEDELKSEQEPAVSNERFQELSESNEKLSQQVKDAEVCKLLYFDLIGTYVRNIWIQCM